MVSGMATTRRRLLIGAAALSGGLAVGFEALRRPWPNPLERELEPGAVTLNPYLLVKPDGAIVVIVPRAEMGQGVSTTLAALVAEELDVDLAAISVEHGPAGAAYANVAAVADSAPFPAFDEGLVASSVREAMGAFSRMLALQFTGGSASTVDAYDRMRLAGATARAMLKTAAARRLGTDEAALSTEGGRVIHAASGRTWSYGELAADAARMPVPTDVTLRDPARWTILGRPQPRKDMRTKVTGAPIFGIDVALPEMLFATVRMNPRLGGAIRTMDPAAADGLPGIVKVVRISGPAGDGFGVIADNTWRAFRAAEAVAATVTWAEAPYPPDSAAIEERLRVAFTTVKPFSLRTLGDPDTAFADAPRDRVVEAEYAVPFLAHATMEPMNATARLKDGIVDIWAPTQAPTLARYVASGIAGLPQEKVRIHVTALGGGFGRRLETDFIAHAVTLAMAVEGRPVKVTWTREEDITHDVYRPAAIGRYRARLGANGFPEAVTGDVAAPSVMASLVGRVMPRLPMAGPDKSIVEGAYDQPYDFAHHRIDGRAADVAVPVGYWRSVGHSYNAFMQECFLDEVAAAGGIDPLALRLKLASKSHAAVGVLEKVAEMAGWSGKPAAGRARGLAYNLSFGTHVAEIVEVAWDEGVENGRIRIEKVWCAADPGRVLDPGIFAAQMMSGIVFGLSAAVGQAITFEDGRVKQSNFHDFDAMRIGACPTIDVALIENAPRMGGAGEPGTPPGAPALANAIFALTGRRIRSLPLSREIAFVV